MIYADDMPILYGILIQMYYDDHDPPHFHAIYGDNRAVIGIADFAMLEGDLPPKAVGLVMEWARRVGMNCSRNGI